MEQRKIMALGRSSLVISLPKNWIKLNELKQGDVVSLAFQRDRSLVVTPGVGKKTWSKEITLHIKPDDKDVSIVRRIIACYLYGYTGIKLISEKIFSVRQQTAIRRIVRILYMRIMESTTKSKHIVTLIDESKASITSGIQRMHKITTAMCRDVLSALKDHDEALAETVYSLDDDVDNSCFFLTRLLRRVTLDSALANQLDLEPIDCLDLQILVNAIQEVADNATSIAKTVAMLKGEQLKIADHLIELLLISGNDAVNSYVEAVEAYLYVREQNIATSEKIIEKKRFIEKLDREIASWSFLHEKKIPFLIGAICSIRESIKRIAEYAATIAEVTINRSFKPKV